MKTLSLAIKLLARDWRAGELRILIAALIIAVAALTSINFYTDRVTRTFDVQSAELLGGDLVLSSPTKPPDTWLIKAKQLKLQSAQLILIPTVVFNNQQMQLISLKAVSGAYPLHGKVRTANALNAPDQAMNTIPAPGTVWVDAQLIALLNIKVGDTLKIGAAQFTVSRIVTYEPDIDSNWLNIAPLVMLNIQDIDKTQVVLPGSRLEYRLLFNGDDASIQTFKAWLKLQIIPGQKLLTAKANRSELKDILQRTNNYLNLVIIICILFAGIAIATSARRYCQRHYDSVALLRTLGMTQRQIIQLFTAHLLMLGLIAASVGCLLGFLIQFSLVALFTNLIKLSLVTTALTPLLLGFVAGLTILLGFVIPDFIRLKNIAPLRMLRREQLPVPNSILSIYGLPLVIIFGLMLWQTRDFHLTLLLTYSLVLSAILLYAIAYLFIQLAGSLRGYTAISWRYGLANLVRRANSSTIQLIAFGLVIMVMLLLTLVRNDLVDTWRQQLPHDAANYFVINIPPDDVKSLTDSLTNNNVTVNGIYPMVRGRLIKLNGIGIKSAVPAAMRNHNALNRELNLSWTTQLPSDNQIIAGQWWNNKDTGKPLVSIEQSLASDFHIKLGDALTFQIGDQTVTAQVDSIRTVQWSSFHPNFYMIFPPGFLNALPTTYITSFYLAPQYKNLLAGLVQQFPSITLIDVDELLKQMHNVVDKMVAIIQYLLLFVLLAGISVLYAAVHASQDERAYEGIILRILGASRRQLQSIFLTEFISLGLLAGSFATISALAISYLLAVNVLHVIYHFNFLVLFSGLVGGTVSVGVIGYYATRKLLQHTPLENLRNI